MLCYVMVCYNILCYVESYHVVLGMLCYVMLCCVVWCGVVWYGVGLGYGVCCVNECCIVLCYVVLYFFFLLLLVYTVIVHLCLQYDWSMVSVPFKWVSNLLTICKFQRFYLDVLLWTLNCLRWNVYKTTTDLNHQTAINLHKPAQEKINK